MRSTSLLLFFVLLTTLSWGAITRTARGSANNKTSSTTFDVDIVDITIGASISFALSHDPETVNSVVLADLCGGAARATLAKDGEATNPANVQVSIWSAHNVPGGGAGCIRVTFAAAVVAKAGVASELLGANGVLTSGASAVGTGTGTDASTSSITCTPNSSADCAWVGGVGTEGPVGDTAGTWVNPDNNGQRNGTTGAGAASNITASEGFEIDSASVTQALSKTGMTSRNWAAVLATYKEPAAGGLTIKDPIMRGLVPRPR